MVLGAAEALGALAGSRSARVDIFGDRRRAHEAHRPDVRIVEDRIDGLLVAVDDVEDARRKPGFDHQFREAHRHARIALGGLEDEGVAGGDGGGELPHRNHGGEVERRDAGDDAEGLADRIDVDSRPRAFRIFALHQMRRAEREFADLEAPLDIASCVGNGLAVFAGEELREVVVVPMQKIDELHHDARAALRIGGGPVGLRGQRVFDRRAQLSLRRQRHLRADFAGHRLVDVGEAARCAFDAPAADEMSVSRHDGFLARRSRPDALFIWTDFSRTKTVISRQPLCKIDHGTDFGRACLRRGAASRTSPRRALIDGP